MSTKPYITGLSRLDPIDEFGTFEEACRHAEKMSRDFLIPYKAWAVNGNEESIALPPLSFKRPIKSDIRIKQIIDKERLR